MNEALKDPNDSVTDALPVESPQFDETAIAAAQPVEPLPAQESRTVLSRPVWRPRGPIVALVILTTVVAVVAALIAVRPLREVAMDTPEAATQPEPSSVQVAAPSPVQLNKSLAAIGPSQRLLMRRSKAPQPRTIAVEDQSRPVARKVGEIFYSRAPNNR